MNPSHLSQKTPVFLRGGPHVAVDENCNLSSSRMKRREGDRAGGINIEDLMLKCRQKVVVWGLKGQKLTTSGH